MYEHWVVLLGIQKYLECFCHGLGGDDIESVLIGWNRYLDMPNAVLHVEVQICSRILLSDQSPITSVRGLIDLCRTLLSLTISS